MKKIVLDTNIIILETNILAKWTPNLELIVPSTVISELLSLNKRKTGQFQNAVNTWEKSSSLGFINCPNIDDLAFDLVNNVEGLSPTDLSLVQYVYNMTKENTEDAVFLATEDRALIRLCNVYNLKTLSRYDLITEISESVTTNISDIPVGSTLEKFLRRSKYLNVIISFITLIVTLLVFLKIDLLAYINPTLFIFIIIIIGLLLFLLRSHFRMIYGLLEIVAGVITAYIVLINIAQVSVDVVLKISAGLYIIVRGLENFAKGLLGTRFELLLKKIFGNKCI